MLRLLSDYDGTLTAEELQVQQLAEGSLLELAESILEIDIEEVRTAYRNAAQTVRDSAGEYGWSVNGCLTSYGDEGALIFHTVTLQTMLAENGHFFEKVVARFAGGRYDPVAACTNHLFHTHSAPLDVQFRAGAAEFLSSLLEQPDVEPVIVTSSLGDKVKRNLDRLDIGAVRILGDTRQYEIDPEWNPPLPGGENKIVADEGHTIDLRRRVYYEALVRETVDGSQLAVVADTLSLPGALPMAMGVRFALLRTKYTPQWSATYVDVHPLGIVLDSLDEVLEWALRDQ